jgi:hypothetical protein
VEKLMGEFQDVRIMLLYYPHILCGWEIQNW